MLYLNAQNLSVTFESFSIKAEAYLGGTIFCLHFPPFACKYSESSSLGEVKDAEELYGMI